MKQLWGTLVIGLFSVAAVASRPLPGPYVLKFVGEPAKDKTWHVCVLRPTKVNVTSYTRGHAPLTEQQEISGIDAKAFSEDIAAASQAKEIHAAHIRETIPHVRIMAADLRSRISRFQVSYDASGYDYKEGEAAARLRDLASKYCGKLHEDLIN